MASKTLIDPGTIALPVVDAFDLGETHRRILRPDQLFDNREGNVYRLPRHFYEVDCWQTALVTQLTAHFQLWEFMAVDVREAEPLRIFPRYVPCAVALLAASLELLRQATGMFLHIAANGGYRSPGHRLTDHASPHCWGAAANIYRVGADLLDSAESIERMVSLARSTLPHAWVRPHGHGKGLADDHLHIDIGYVLVTPRGAASELGSA